MKTSKTHLEARQANTMHRDHQYEKLHKFIYSYIQTSLKALLIQDDNLKKKSGLFGVFYLLLFFFPSKYSYRIKKSQKNNSFMLSIVTANIFFTETGSQARNSYT